MTTQQQRTSPIAGSAETVDVGPRSADGWILAAAAFPLVLIAGVFAGWKYTASNHVADVSSTDSRAPNRDFSHLPRVTLQQPATSQPAEQTPNKQAELSTQEEIAQTVASPPDVLAVVETAIAPAMQPQLPPPVKDLPQPVAKQAPDLWALFAHLPAELPKPPPPAKPVIAIPPGAKLAADVDGALGRLDEASPGPERLEAIQHAFPIIEKAARGGCEEEASRLSLAVVTLARKGSSSDTIRLARDTAARMQRLLEFRQAADAAVRVLNDRAEDSRANVILGKYLCLIRGDWDAGLPFLAKGDNLSLKTAAVQDLQNVNEPEKLVKVGDNWWNIIPLVDDAQRSQLYQRAHLYYTVALANSLGPQHRIEPAEKAKAEQRRDLAARVMASPAGADLPETPKVAEGPPSVVSFRPMIGLPGQEIAMQGRGFAAVKQIYFWSGIKNEPAEFRVVSDTQLLVIAPVMNHLRWPNGEVIITVVTPWGAAVVSPALSFQYDANNATMLSSAAYGASRGRLCSVVRSDVAVFGETGSFIEGGGSGNVYFLQDGAVLNMGRDSNAIVYYEPKATINNRDEKATFIPVPSIEARYIGGSFRYLPVRY